MCKFWKQEKCNHHFPELNKKRGLRRRAAKFFTLNKIAAIMVLAVVAIGLTYLIQTNLVATEGYQIKDLQQKADELKAEHDKLNLQYIELQSMANVINKTSDLNLVVIDQMEVISPLGSVVALR